MHHARPSPDSSGYPAGGPPKHWAGQRGSSSVWPETEVEQGFSAHASKKNGGSAAPFLFGNLYCRRLLALAMKAAEAPNDFGRIYVNLKSWGNFLGGKAFIICQRNFLQIRVGCGLYLSPSYFQPLNIFFIKSPQQGLYTAHKIIREFREKIYNQPLMAAYKT